jgi:hypothetical protein
MLMVDDFRDLEVAGPGLDRVKTHLTIEAVVLRCLYLAIIDGGK